MNQILKERLGIESTLGIICLAIGWVISSSSLTQFISYKSYSNLNVFTRIQATLQIISLYFTPPQTLKIYLHTYGESFFL